MKQVSSLPGFINRDPSSGLYNSYFNNSSIQEDYFLADKVQPQLARPRFRGASVGRLNISDGCVGACAVSCAAACIGACIWCPVCDACNQCVDYCMDSCARNC